MKSSRSTFPYLFLVFILLFAQQAGAAHALHHALEGTLQHNEHKSLPHSNACEQCADYAQLGTALSTAVFAFTPPQLFDESIFHGDAVLCTLPPPPASARAPPLQFPA